MFIYFEIELDHGNVAKTYPSRGGTIVILHAKIDVRIFLNARNTENHNWIRVLQTKIEAF